MHSSLIYTYYLVESEDVGQVETHVILEINSIKIIIAFLKEIT